MAIKVEEINYVTVDPSGNMFGWAEKPYWEPVLGEWLHDDPDTVMGYLANIGAIGPETAETLIFAATRTQFSESSDDVR